MFTTFKEFFADFFKPATKTKLNLSVVELPKQDGNIDFESAINFLKKLHDAIAAPADAEAVLSILNQPLLNNLTFAQLSFSKMQTREQKKEFAKQYTALLTKIITTDQSKASAILHHLNSDSENPSSNIILRSGGEQAFAKFLSQMKTTAPASFSAEAIYLLLMRAFIARTKELQVFERAEAATLFSRVNEIKFENLPPMAALMAIPGIQKIDYINLLTLMCAEGLSVPMINRLVSLAGISDLVTGLFKESKAAAKESDKDDYAMIDLPVDQQTMAFDADDQDKDSGEKTAGQKSLSQSTAERLMQLLNFRTFATPGTAVDFGVKPAVECYLLMEYLSADESLAAFITDLDWREPDSKNLVERSNAYTLIYRLLDCQVPVPAAALLAHITVSTAHNFFPLLNKLLAKDPSNCKFVATLLTNTQTVKIIQDAENERFLGELLDMITKLAEHQNADVKATAFEIVKAIPFGQLLIAPQYKVQALEKWCALVSVLQQNGNATDALFSNAFDEAVSKSNDIIKIFTLARVNIVPGSAIQHFAVHAPALVNHLITTKDLVSLRAAKDSGTGLGKVVAAYLQQQNQRYSVTKLWSSSIDVLSQINAAIAELEKAATAVPSNGLK